MESTGSAFGVKIIKKLHDEKTPYQHIEIFETEQFGNLMVIDGCFMVTDRDNFFYHEMMSHPALLTHENPKRVVIIGGGDCGTMREVLRHDSVTEAWQVEIDERVTRLAEIYFPELCSANEDPRAHFYFGDGIEWIRNAKEGSFDVIIIDSTDPVGPAEGLFAKPFYQDCFRALAPKGILVQQSESPLLHVNLLQQMRSSLTSAGFNKVATLQYPQCSYPSGWWSATMAGKGSDPKRFRVDAARKLNFKTEYYDADVHQAALVLPPYVRRALGE